MVATSTHYERIGVLDRPEPACLPHVSVALPSMRREQARGGAAPRCCAAWVVWRSRPRSSEYSPACTWPGSSPASPAWLHARPSRSDGVRQGTRSRAGPAAVSRRDRPSLTTGLHGPGPSGDGRVSRRLGRGQNRGTPGGSPLRFARQFLVRTICAGGPLSERAPEPDYSGACRGCSSAGRALLSQCRGRGFESLHLHQRPRSEA